MQSDFFVINSNNRAFFNIVPQFLYCLNNQISAAIRANVAGSELNNARFIHRRNSKNGAKVKIVCKDHKIMNPGVICDLSIRCISRSNIYPVNCFYVPLGKKTNPARRKVHVNKNFHNPVLRTSQNNFPFFNPPGSVTKSLKNIFPFKVGIIGEKFFNANSRTNLSNNHANSYPHSPYAGLASHKARFSCDTVKVHFHNELSIMPDRKKRNPIPQPVPKPAPLSAPLRSPRLCVRNLGTAA